MPFHRFKLGAFLLPAVLAAGLLGACGGGGGGGGTGSDEQFVADVCKAGAKFQDDLTKLITKLTTIDSEEEAAKEIAKPFEDFAASFKKAKPPADLKEWHTEAGKSLDQAVAALKKGDTSTFDGDPFPEPPSGAADRLNKIAEKNADCQKAQLFSE